MGHGLGRRAGTRRVSWCYVPVVKIHGAPTAESCGVLRSAVVWVVGFKDNMVSNLRHDISMTLTTNTCWWRACWSCGLSSPLDSTGLLKCWHRRSHKPERNLNTSACAQHFQKKLIWDELRVFNLWRSFAPPHFSPVSWFQAASAKHRFS